ncbi:MAG TPA: O-antigen ligase family protein [Phycisphaerae bacterium]|nr:O-antigen ligase family protein [Phycisphaerae bacterium]
MALIRIEKSDEIRPSHIVMLAVVVLALAGNCLLTSAGKPAMLPDGAVEWAPNSLLLAIVEILDLQYAQPTPNGVAIKGLVEGVAAGVALLIAAIGLVAWARAEAGREADVVEQVADGDVELAPESLVRRQLNPVRTAQALMLLYLAWSFASIWWSDAPQFARGGAILLAIQTAWAFALAFGLNRRAAVYAGYCLLAVLVVTAGLAIVYQRLRNPTLRASYPVGNPLFLASCLLPGVAIAVAALVGGGGDVSHGARSRGLIKILLCGGALVVLAWATYLTHSRGPAVGLLVAFMVLVLLAVGRRVRIVFGAMFLVGLVVLGAYLYHQRSATSKTGRSESMRLRLYAWPYALDLFQQQPLLGIGQGGYTLQADVHAIQDVENDPAPLEYRVAHAHQEWLEVAADLGTVGLVLILGSLGLTVLAAVRALPQMRKRGERAMAVALIGALVGLVAAECFGVGLRHVGLPIVYFTIIGLLWSLASPVPAKTLAALGRSTVACVGCIVLAAVVCIVSIEMSRRDFAAARAAHDVPAALQQDDLEQAEQLAIRAYTDRLSPMRKLTAQRLLVNTRLQIASALQQRYRRQLGLLNAAQNEDPRLKALADQYRKACEQQLDLGEATLADMVAVAPSMFYSGSIMQAFMELRSVFAAIDGDAQAMTKYRMAAAAALRNELARRPFDADLAARYVMVDFDQLQTSDMITLLARPLRLQRPQSIYLDVLRRMLATGGAQMYFARFDHLAELPVPQDRVNWPDPWVPETLRLGSIMAYLQADYARATHYLQAALPYYAALDGEALLAHASTYAELADMQFNAAPQDVTPAIDSAQQALKIAPNSEAGRQLTAQVAVRLVLYHLAAGHEEFARKIYRDRVPDITAEQLDAEIADRYVQLAFAVYDAAWANCPDKLAAWSQRALELAPEDSGPWFLSAELALSRRDAAGVVAGVKSVLKYDGDPQDALALLERALTVMPGDADLQKLHDQLRAALQQQTPTAPQETPVPEPQRGRENTGTPPAANTSGAGELPAPANTTGVAISTNGA